MQKFKEILASILAVPVTALVMLCSAIRGLLVMPLDWFRYRKSHFRKDLGQKFHRKLCASPTYRLYNLIRERNLPIRFFPRDSARPSDGGWFLYQSTLIVHDLQVLRYDAPQNCWRTNGNKALMEYVLEQVQEVNQVPGHAECTQMLLPLERSRIVKRDLARAEQDFRFVLYDKGELGEILDAYIRTHPLG